MEIKEGLAFDDVLLVPKKSSVVSRKEVSTETFLTRKIKLNIPIVAANMDSVCEATMAIALAREGGIGIVHRFLPIEKQVEKVLRVKRAESIEIENPFTVFPDSTLHDVKKIMDEHGVHSILVVNTERKLKGILTSRDIRFEKDFSKKLLQGIFDHKKNIEAEIQESAPEWPLNRIAAIDRAILELGVYELLYEEEIPPLVTINECVELAKEMGNENSHKFVNGVLSTIMHKHNKNEKKI